MNAKWNNSNHEIFVIMCFEILSIVENVISKMHDARPSFGDEW